MRDDAICDLCSATVPGDEIHTCRECGASVCSDCLGDIVDEICEKCLEEL